jgi:glycosyltransferase involved in cell wall biosynthesis
MKILFLSRAYPPTVGGIENQNAAIATWLGKKADVTTIANRRGKRFLPVFLPYVTIRAFFAAFRADAILLGDGVLAPIGYFLKLTHPRTPVLSVIHGLDLTFGMKQGLLAKLYQAINLPSLRNLDRLLAVSRQTKDVAVSIGVPEANISVIPNGIDPDDVLETHDRSDLDRLLGEDTGNRFVILRVGRYVKHKGVEWFIRNVVPTLPANVLFIAAGAVVRKKTAGDDDYFPLCEKAVKELGLEGKVRLLTDLPQSDLTILYNTADIAVSPNIPVPGSMEGFGINVLEASICGLPVIASRLEGLAEAVQDGENGRLVEPKDAGAFRDVILEFMQDEDKRKSFGAHAATYTKKHYHWDAISDKYIKVLQQEISKS